MIKFRPLTKDEIEVKVKMVKENGLVALLYKTARTDMDLLDETVGPENWECHYSEIKGNLYCGISVLVDGTRNVTKWDCGIESREDEEGNEKKGEASDAFKRAGFKWGIGRELYTSPFIWIPAANCDIKKGMGAGKVVHKCFDKFIVDSIEYSEDGKRITGLAIVNQTTGKVAYTWKDKQEKKPAATKKNEEPEDTKRNPEITPEKVGELFYLAEATNTKHSAILGAYGVEDAYHLTNEQFASAIRTLKAKQIKQAQKEKEGTQ